MCLNVVSLLKSLCTRSAGLLFVFFWSDVTDVPQHDVKSSNINLSINDCRGLVVCER